MDGVVQFGVERHVEVLIGVAELFQDEDQGQDLNSEGEREKRQRVCSFLNYCAYKIKQQHY
jgi:hypothetical protein